MKTLIELPEGLVLEANAAGVSVQVVAEEAIRTTLQLRRSQAPTPAGVGNEADPRDRYRYREGLDVGRRWARSAATAEELADLAALGTSAGTSGTASTSTFITDSALETSRGAGDGLEVGCRCCLVRG